MAPPNLRWRRTDFLQETSLVNGLRLFWIAVVLWCELGAFIWSLVGCHWPDKDLTNADLATHVLIVADPQVLDRHSYPGRAPWLVGLTTHIVDVNLRKSWRAVLAGFRPHMVLFLGDMMDNGRSNMGDAEYERYYRRFRSIFRLDASTPAYYLPGNHDVDLGHSSGASSDARTRYHAHFGPANQRIDIGNHTTLILFDAPGLVDEDYGGYAAQVDFRKWQGSHGGSAEFLKAVIKHRPTGSIVLFSHIPLYRPDHVSCGPLREKGTIRPGYGQGYQNVLLPATSSFILENIRPALVFSGDDHDYCEYIHHLPDKSTIREVTVKSFSMAMGVRRPGFQLLSITPPQHGHVPPSSSVSTTLADALCLLPDQIKIYTHYYAPLGLLTVFMLFFVNYRQQRRWHRGTTRAKGLTRLCPPSSDGSVVPSSPITHRHGQHYGVSVSRGMDGFDEDEDRLSSLPLAEVNLLGRHDSSSLPRYASHAQLDPSRNARSTFRRCLFGRGVFRRARAFCVRWMPLRLLKALMELYRVAWPPLTVYIIITLVVLVY